MPRIMVVDDEKPIRITVREALESAGHAVTTCASGREAREILDDPNIPCPQLIILDVMMPGLDGHTLHNMLQADERTRRIPLIVITGKKELKETFEQSMNVFAFLEKPFDLDVLRLKVAQALKAEVNAAGGGAP